MSDKKESVIKMLLVLLSLILSIFLLFGSFFMIYSNEVIPDRSEKKTIRETSILYKKVFLWDYVKATASYKNKIVTSEDKSSEFLVKWVIRIFWIFSLGFALTLLLIPVFPNEEKDNLAVKSFKISLIVIPVFIILIKIYLFYLAWWFNFSWLVEKEGSAWWLSVIDKFFIIILIVLAFVAVWYIYYYKKKREEEWE